VGTREKEGIEDNRQTFGKITSYSFIPSPKYELSRSYFSVRFC